ncbi:MAG: sulfate ABC transporter ATP-binding protein [Oligoflexia bacterium]|nr:sulfate ABC transporter ATP-binding protein [Oligoflexia bacterium]MBF0365845.1 sulfate ABC transporter ATP-binding protein [Oligoflexia bacterium]
MSIIVKNISKTFGNFKALDAIHFQLPANNLIALLGPSGCGKTTLLRIIAGLEQADHGEVSFQNADLLAFPANKRQIGLVFQHYALFKHMTVFDNIAFGLKVKPKKYRPSHQEISKKVHELLKLIKLENLADRYPRGLSGGQCQRVALARALAIEPRLLLLDEPFGALDAKVRAEMRRWLRNLHDTLKVTSIFVTHDQEEALEVADIIIIMNQGRIEQIGTPDEVFHHPANEFVMSFLGEVNVFHGRRDENHPKLMIRPHQLKIEHAKNKSSLQARAIRVITAGPFVRVELLDENDHNSKRIQVQMTHEQYRSNPVLPNSLVYLSPKDQ